MNIQHGYQEITPEMAEQILRENNIGNRTLSHTTCESYTRDMENGRWYNNLIPITFCEDGRLIDGQHRLYAVYKSGIAQSFQVNVLPKSACSGIDAGRARSIKDILHFQNVGSIDDLLTTSIIADVRFLLSITKDGSVDSACYKFTADEVKNFILNHESDLREVLDILPVKNMFTAPEFSAVFVAYISGTTRTRNAVKRVVKFLHSGDMESLDGAGWTQMRDRRVRKVYPFISRSSGKSRSCGYYAMQLMIHKAESNKEFKVYRDNMNGNVFYAPTYKD